MSDTATALVCPPDVRNTTITMFTHTLLRLFWDEVGLLFEYRTRKYTSPEVLPPEFYTLLRLFCFSGGPSSGVFFLRSFNK